MAGTRSSMSGSKIIVSAQLNQPRHNLFMCELMVLKSRHYERCLWISVGCSAEGHTSTSQSTQELITLLTSKSICGYLSITRRTKFSSIADLNRWPLPRHVFTCHCQGWRLNAMSTKCAVSICWSVSGLRVTFSDNQVCVFVYFFFVLLYLDVHITCCCASMQFDGIICKLSREIIYIF